MSSSMIINFLACMVADDVQGEGGIPNSSHAGQAPRTKSLAPAPRPESLTSSRDVFGPNQWQASAQPIQMVHQSDQGVQGSEPPPFSNMLIEQHADHLTGRSAPINIPSHQPAVVQCPRVEQGVLYYPPYVNIPHLECALLNVQLE